MPLVNFSFNLSSKINAKAYCLFSFLLNDDRSLSVKFYKVKFMQVWP